MDIRPADAVTREIERVCRTLATQCQGISAWEWDDRFSAALTVARGPAQGALQAQLAAALPSQWDDHGVAAAPAALKRLSEAWGMRAGQKLYCLAPTEDPLLVGAWWPWNGGNAASLRVACVPYGEHAAQVAPPDSLKPYFGL